MADILQNAVKEFIDYKMTKNDFWKHLSKNGITTQLCSDMSKIYKDNHGTNYNTMLT